MYTHALPAARATGASERRPSHPAWMYGDTRRARLGDAEVVWGLLYHQIPQQIDEAEQMPGAALDREWQARVGEARSELSTLASAYRAMGYERAADTPLDSAGLLSMLALRDAGGAPLFSGGEADSIVGWNAEGNPRAAMRFVAAILLARAMSLQQRIAEEAAALHARLLTGTYLPTPSVATAHAIASRPQPMRADPLPQPAATGAAGAALAAPSRRGTSALDAAVLATPLSAPGAQVDILPAAALAAGGAAGSGRASHAAARIAAASWSAPRAAAHARVPDPPQRAAAMGADGAGAGAGTRAHMTRLETLAAQQRALGTAPSAPTTTLGPHAAPAAPWIAFAGAGGATLAPTTTVRIVTPRVVLDSTAVAEPGARVAHQPRDAVHVADLTAHALPPTRSGRHAGTRSHDASGRTGTAAAAAAAPSHRQIAVVQDTLLSEPRVVARPLTLPEAQFQLNRALARSDTLAALAADAQRAAGARGGGGAPSGVSALIETSQRARAAAEYLADLIEALFRSATPPPAAAVQEHVATAYYWYDTLDGRDLLAAYYHGPFLSEEDAMRDATEFVRSANGVARGRAMLLYADAALGWAESEFARGCCGAHANISTAAIRIALPVGPPAPFPPLGYEHARAGARRHTHGDTGRDEHDDASDSDSDSDSDDGTAALDGEDDAQWLLAVGQPWNDEALNGQYRSAYEQFLGASGHLSDSVHARREFASRAAPLAVLAWNRAVGRLLHDPNGYVLPAYAENVYCGAATAPSATAHCWAVTVALYPLSSRWLASTRAASGQRAPAATADDALEAASELQTALRALAEPAALEERLAEADADIRGIAHATYPDATVERLYADDDPSVSWIRVAVPVSEDRTFDRDAALSIAYAGFGALMQHGVVPDQSRSTLARTDPRTGKVISEEPVPPVPLDAVYFYA